MKFGFCGFDSKEAYVGYWVFGFLADTLGVLDLISWFYQNKMCAFVGVCHLKCTYVKYLLSLLY